MIIAQITDLHVQADGDLAYGVVDTTPLVERAIAHLNALNPHPDVVVATGDLVHRGGLREYQQLRTILEKGLCRSCLSSDPNRASELCDREQSRPDDYARHHDSGGRRRLD